MLSYQRVEKMSYNMVSCNDCFARLQFGDHRYSRWSNFPLCRITKMQLYIGRNHFHLNSVKPSIFLCRHVSASSQSLHFILSLRMNSSFITSRPGSALFALEYSIKILRITPNTTDFGNGLVLLLRVDKSIQLKWVKTQ